MAILGGHLYADTTSKSSSGIGLTQRAQEAFMSAVCRRFVTDGRLVERLKPRISSTSSRLLGLGTKMTAEELGRQLVLLSREAMAGKDAVWTVLEELLEMPEVGSELLEDLDEEEKDSVRLLLEETSELLLGAGKADASPLGSSNAVSRLCDAGVEAAVKKVAAEMELQGEERLPVAKLVPILSRAFEDSVGSAR